MMVDISSRLGALASSEQALSRGLETLSDEEASYPSLLPGWSRGHVLTHLARNADGLLNLVQWASTGVETPMYASQEQRAADIEAGSSRQAGELVADVRESQARLMAALGALGDDEWHALIRWGRANRESDAAALPVLRRIEVEVHHVDLDLDYTMAHWPEDLVETMLTETAADYSARPDCPGFVLAGTDDEGPWTVAGGGPVISGAPPALLGWLLGRSDGTGLHHEGALPQIGAWR